MTTRRALAALAALMIGGATLAIAQPATAAAFDGVLGIKGPGSVYAGTNASGLSASSAVSQVAVPGGTATFAVEVINKGTDTAQFELDLVNRDGGVSRPQLLSGSLDVTGLAIGAHGLVTNPLQPGKTQLFTLKVAIPSSVSYEQNFLNTLTLYSVGRGTRLDVAATAVSLKTAIRPGNGEFFATSPYQPTVRGDDGYYDGPTFMTAATIKTNSTATFTATIRGGGTDVNSKGIQDQLSLTRIQTCAASSWIVDAKVGSYDITDQLFAGTYQTPVITPSGSLVIKITVKAVSPVPDTLGCTDTQELLLSAVEVNQQYLTPWRTDLITNTVS